MLILNSLVVNLSKMNKQEEIELIKTYLDLSNRHRIDLILPLFDEDVNYQSSNVGEFNGKKAVGEMMQDFFSRYPDVSWKMETFQHTGKHTISFDFVMTATEPESGSIFERAGFEQIELSSEGLIVQVEVKAQ